MQQTLENTTKVSGISRLRFRKGAIAVLMLLLVVLVAGVFFIRAQKISSLKQAEKTLKTGTENYNQGKFDKAITSLEKTAKLDPNNPKAHLLLARSYEATGKLKEAETSYKASLDADPKQPEALYNLAIIHKTQGKTREAIKELEKAINLNKDFVAARLILAELFTQQDDKKKAIEQYKIVIKMKPFGVNLTEIEKKLDVLE